MKRNGVEWSGVGRGEERALSMKVSFFSPFYAICFLLPSVYLSVDYRVSWGYFPSMSSDAKTVTDTRRQERGTIGTKTYMHIDMKFHV
mmetsp:Transcript_18797/g.31480  ORF Transcript_18797/g.31480 Transcript_18797/m.31480 type:complete len:88 (-) Transcript_18797:85-348(-)